MLAQGYASKTMYMVNLKRRRRRSARLQNQRAVVLFVVHAVDRCRVAQGLRGEGGSQCGARATRVALSPESRAPRNACIIIMTDADRVAAPLICGAFDLAAGAGPDAPTAQTSRPLAYSVGRHAVHRTGPFALVLNRGFIL